MVKMEQTYPFLLNNLLKKTHHKKDCCYYIGDTLVDLNFSKNCINNLFFANWIWKN